MKAKTGQSITLNDNLVGAFFTKGKQYEVVNTADYNDFITVIDDTNHSHSLSKQYYTIVEEKESVQNNKPKVKDFLSYVEGWLDTNTCDRGYLTMDAMKSALKNSLSMIGDYQDGIEHFVERKANKNMTLNEYQNKAVETAIYGSGNNIIYPTLGLVGEAGEVANKVKKVLRDNNGQFTDDKKKEIAFELGDSLWYIAALARDLGYSLDEIAYGNIHKLASRKERNMIGGSGDNR
jgi:NTP pyrophosphatase (non-canonical NTP hydrolase)